MDDLKHILPGSRIRNDIIAAIDARQLKPGDAVMTVDKLSAHYGVARKTAHRTLQGLVRDGYLVSRRGSGTFVRDRKQHGNTRTRVAIQSSHGKLTQTYGGIRQQLVEHFNSERDDILLEWRETPTTDATPEVVLFGNTPPPAGLLRLDTFKDYSSICDSIHPRLLRDDAQLPGELARAALPITWMTRCLSVNQDVAPAGSVPSTWNELLSWSRAASKQPPTYLLFNRHDPLARYLPFYWMAGGNDLYDATSHKVTIDEQALRTWLDFFGELRPFLQPLSTSVPVEPLLTGDYLYNIVEGPWIRPQARKSASKTTISLYPPPRPTLAAPPVGMLSVVRAGIAHKQLNETEKAACWEVIRYLLSPNVQAKINDAFGVLPVCRDGLEEPWGTLIEHTRQVAWDPVNRELSRALALEFYLYLEQGRSASQAITNFQSNANAIAAIYG